MKSLKDINRKIRNISFILVIISFSLMIGWTVFASVSMSTDYYFILIIGVSIFIPSIFAFTRIQFVLWLQKRLEKKS